MTPETISSIPDWLTFFLILAMAWFIRTTDLAKLYEENVKLRRENREKDDRIAELEADSDESREARQSKAKQWEYEVGPHAELIVALLSMKSAENGIPYKALVPLLSSNDGPGLTKQEIELAIERLDQRVYLDRGSDRHETIFKLRNPNGLEFASRLGVLGADGVAERAKILELFGLSETIEGSSKQ